MKKLMMLAAMLAMVLVAAAPALADTENETDIEDSYNEENTDIQYENNDVTTGGIGVGENAACLALQNAINTGDVEADVESDQYVNQYNNANQEEVVDLGLELFGDDEAEADQEVDEQNPEADTEGTITVSPTQVQACGL